MGHIIYVLPINNKVQLVFGKIATAKNNTQATYTLPKAYTKSFVCMANATIRNHWSNITASSLSTISIHIADYGNAVASGFHYLCIGF